MTSAHPRLYLRPEHWARLQQAPALPFLVQAQAGLESQTETWAGVPELVYHRNGHNYLLHRAREMQACVICLLARWQQTGDDRFRAAAIAYVRQMRDWPYWSWIAMRDEDPAPDAIFDLSYGENSATIAIAFDILHDSLTADERAMFIDLAEHWPLPAARRHLLSGTAWWFKHDSSNWNTVCAGGLGMLVLALHEHLPDGDELLAQVEVSVTPFMRNLDRTEGAWPEGTGYWNYGMRYAFMYLLSHSAAHGQIHPLLALDGVRQTLRFPLDFTPHGQACSFGDVNNWTPLPFHYAVADCLGDDQTCAALDAYVAASGFGNAWAANAGWRLLHRNCATTAQTATSGPTIRLYGGLDWGVLSDRWPAPRLFATVRGGTTEVPHGHLDLMSFHCVVGDEKMIASLGPRGYLDTTFSPRRWDLFEMAPPAKNTLFINGVGIQTPATLDRTETIERADCVGLRLIGTSAMGVSRNGPACTFCGRVFLLFDDRALLILDCIKTKFEALVENRLHTYASAATDEAGALLSGKRQTLRVRYAGSVDCALRTAVPAMTMITDEPPTTLRWATTGLNCEAVLVTLLTPGVGESTAEVNDGVVSCATGDWQTTLTVAELMGVR